MNRVLFATVLFLAVSPVVSEQQKTVTMAEYERVMLARDLAVMGLTANAATLLRDGKSEKALLLLDAELSSSLDAASHRVDAGVRLPIEQSVSLRKAPERARDYALRQNRELMAKQAAALAANLNDAAER